MLYLKMNSNGSLKCTFCPHANISPEILPVRELSLSLLPGERSKLLPCWISLLVNPVSNTGDVSGSTELSVKSLKRSHSAVISVRDPTELRLRSCA